jgi:Mg2+/Co2+ transporter CorB
MNNSSGSEAEKWMQALHWIQIRKNNIGTIVDGHGQILSIDDLEKFADNLLSKYTDIKN